ncbi:hypothetical protein [Enterococcus sp. DIV1059_2]|uniref:hypothetical protein n=1 Tax=Enterococcus sp. DIV1059_2 TaxID=2774664 RepID=UPI003F1E5DC3
MQRLYMEDIKEMSIQNVLELNEWYKKLGGKESCYLLDKKNFFTANRTKQNQEYEFVFRKRLYFYPFNTLGELTEYATKHKCYFEYRGSNESTKEQEKEREMSFTTVSFCKDSFSETHKDTLIYPFYHFEMEIIPKTKTSSDYDFFKEYISDDTQNLAPSDEVQCVRSLFYEDIETMTIKNAEEWQKFYDQWIQKQNAHFLDRKEYYPNIKQTVAIQYHKLEIQAFSQEELEMELKKVGYLFSHKPENGWTEQRNTKLFKIVDEASKPISYLFLGVREDIIELKK